MSQVLALIYATYPDLASARAAAKTILEKRLAACCNLLPGMESHYVWEGSTQSAEEVVMLCKTTHACASELMAEIATCHPYDTPAILQLPLDAVAEKFRYWVEASVA